MKRRYVKGKEILAVEVDGPFREERIDPPRYLETREQWLREFGISLPPRDYLPRFGDPEELRLVLSPVTGTILFTDTSWIQYRFERGFITDLASVPKPIRGLVDNDDLRVLLAAYIHDRNFTSHVLDFSETNRLFYMMLRERGYPLPRSAVAFLAVSSPVGHYRWRKNQARDPWTEKTSSFLTSK